MRWPVLCIVGVIYNVRLDDWTDELVIIASNGVMGKLHSQYRAKKVKIYVY